MVFLQAFMAVFLSFGAWSVEVAPAKTLLSCVTEIPSTSYFITDEGDHFKLQIYHHNGVNFMPIHRGTLVPHEIPKFADRAQLLMKMGVRPSVKFEKSECRQDEGLWRCSNQRRHLLGDLEVDGFYFAMGKLESKYDGMAWNSIETFLIFRVGVESINIPMTFQERDCRSSI